MKTITIKKSKLLKSQAFKNAVKLYTSCGRLSHLLQVFILWEGQEYETACKVDRTFPKYSEVCADLITFEPAKDLSRRKRILALFEKELPK